MKPDMGVFVFKCIPAEKSYLGLGQNIKGEMNSIAFQLNLGSYKNSNLQNDWKKYGENNFEIKILELLPYGKNEMKTDYKEDLHILRDFYAQQFADYEFIQK